MNIIEKTEVILEFCEVISLNTRRYNCASLPYRHSAAENEIIQTANKYFERI
jgi:hypothetical protein